MKNKIYITNEQKKIHLTDKHKALIKKIIGAALKHENVTVPCELSVTVVDEERIRELNRDYRNKDAVTDVLSFPLFERGSVPTETENGEPTALGDIVLCAPRAYAQSVEYGHSFERELCFLTVHSILHLLGYDHETSERDEQYMNETCDAVLSDAGLTRDYVGEPVELCGDAEKSDEPDSDEPCSSDNTPDAVSDVPREKMRTGFICILGRPNVGKSTLMNTILGEKVAIVSKKPQTTRNKITGVHTVGCDQFVFIDTPGIHKPKNKLGEMMMKEASDSASGTDAIVFIVEPTEKPSKTELEIAEKINALKVPAVLVINKADDYKKTKILTTIENFKDLCDFKSIVPISALKNDGVDIVLSELSPFLKNEPWYFAPDMLTDQPVRQIAAEVIREKILRLLDDEIPHGVAVVIEDFDEGQSLIKIRADLYCEKEAHKKIIIGKNGETLKKIGTFAREDLEAFFEKKVFLDLWVKVKENWRDSILNLNRLGFREER